MIQSVPVGRKCGRNDISGTFLFFDVFCGEIGSQTQPDKKDVLGFEQFMKRYQAGLIIEREAGNCLKEE